MELNRVKILADKYFDGLTSQEEEQELREALLDIDDLDDELKALKIMLGAMNEIRRTVSPVEPIRPSEPRKILWLGRVVAVAIAACAIFGIVIGFDSREESVLETPGIICYVDGVLVSDQVLARAETDRVLGGVADNMALAMAKIERLKIVKTE